MQIYEFEDYRKYLRFWISHRPGKGRGEISRLAKAAQCHVTYFSQALHGKVELGLEQAHRLNSPLGHSNLEAEYFLLMVMAARAGTKQLRDYFEKKQSAIKQDYFNLKNRIRSEEALSNDDKMTYYSAWYYIAVHVATSISYLQTKDKLSRELAIGPKKISEVLAFLVRVGLVQEKAGRYEYKSGHMHLPNDSPLISKHHTNWRMKAIANLETDFSEDLHYSSVVSIAEKDFPKVKEIMIEAIEKVRDLVRESPEEALVGYSLDAFRIVSKLSL